MAFDRMNGVSSGRGAGKGPSSGEGRLGKGRPAKVCLCMGRKYSVAVAKGHDGEKSG